MDKDQRAKQVLEKREVIERLYALWVQHPDMRLTQLVRNIFPIDQDLYHIEDYEFIRCLEEGYAEWDEA
jgi:hypothetical protein